MTRASLLLPAAFVLTLAGCSSSPEPLSAGSSATPVDALSVGQILRDNTGLTEGAMGLYRIAVDPDAASATVELLASRGLAQTDDLYLLSIDSFLGANDFRIRSVSRNGGMLDLGWELAHPFPAPQDPAGTPNGRTNRADLGIAGRLVVLADVPSATGNSFFADGGDPVVANTALVANPDAYFRPEGLVNLAAVANTFPYQALVDESGLDGSRVGLSHGGQPTGNFGSDGWTRTELGFDNNGWTGYGVLHQGQRTRRTLSLNISALGSGAISLDVAILAKYNDPRGGQTGAQKKANRLPPAFPDPAAFAYRMPHGALDVERISYEGIDANFMVDQSSTQLLSFRVTDWDTRASETAEADLGGDLDVTTVAAGEAGPPTLAVCIPGVLGDATAVQSFSPALSLVDNDPGGDPEPDSGQPGDTLYYALNVDKTVTSGQTAGSYTGLVRATDVEASLDTSSWRFHLDPNLAPLAVNLPRPETFQAFPVELETVTAPFSGWFYAPQGNGTEYIYGTVVDPFGNTIVTGYSAEQTTSPGPVNYGGGTRTNGGASDLYIVKLDPAGAYLWDYHITAAGAQQIVEVVTDTVGNIYGGGFYGGSVDFGSGVRTSAGGNDIVLVKLSPAGTYLWDRVYGGTTGTDNTRGLAIDSSNNVLLVGSFGGTVNFGGGPRVAQGSDSMIIKVDSNGTYLWDAPISGAGSDWMYAGAVDNAGNIWVSGFFTGTADYGMGPMISSGGNDVPLLRYNSSGTLTLSQKFGGTASEWGWDITVDPVSQGPIIAGYSNSVSIDYGGGLRSGSGTSNIFVVKHTSSGAYVWDKHFDFAVNQEAYAVEADAAGNVYLGGDIEGTVNFGLGPVTSVGSDDAFVLKLDASGTPLWQSVWGGSSSDGVDEIALAPNGSLRVGGIFLSANVDFDPGPGVGLGSAVFIDAFCNALDSTTGTW